MKYIFLFKFIIYWTCSIYAQKNINSIYFEYPESNDFTTQKVLPSKFYGDFFKLHDSLINLKLDSNGIFISHNVVFPIPKEEMKVLQTYIKEDSIYGIKSNKGPPFKSINDTYGHPGGDEVLKAVANGLRDACGENVIGRVGGEEFIAVLENKEGMSLNDYCENIRKAVVELSIPFQDVEINITISGGVINSSEVKDQEELVNLADERLYKAKEGGRNQFVYS